MATEGRSDSNEPHTPELVTVDVEAPLALCSAHGELESATAVALTLLRRLRVVTGELPTPLPASLWRALEEVSIGSAIAWRAPDGAAGLLGCTRYTVRHGGFLLLMRELSDERALSGQELARERDRATGRLIAGVAHDLRSSLASIVYSADLLEGHEGAEQRASLRATVDDICDASRRLQLTVDGLLDYAHLGPAVSVPISLRELFHRVQALLRTLSPEEPQRIHVEIETNAEWVRGNPVAIEQVLVSLLLGASAHARGPRPIVVRCRCLAPVEGERSTGQVQIRIAEESALFGADSAGDPGRDSAWATHLALSPTRSLTDHESGLVLERTQKRPSLTIELPRSQGPR